MRSRRRRSRRSAPTCASRTFCEKSGTTTAPSWPGERPWPCGKFDRIPMQTDVLHKGTPMAAVMAGAEPRRTEWIGKAVIAICVGLTVYLALIPLGFLLWQSFFTPQTADKAAQFTLGNYQEAYGSGETLRL